MEQLSNVFDLYYIYSTVLFTYLIIKFVDNLDKTKPLSIVIKESITVVISSLVAGIFLKYNWVEGKSLLPSFFASIIAYDKLIKPILDVLNIGYIKE